LSRLTSECVTAMLQCKLDTTKNHRFSFGKSLSRRRYTNIPATVAYSHAVSTMISYKENPFNFKNFR
jgi:hypothetical protein